MLSICQVSDATQELEIDEGRQKLKYHLSQNQNTICRLCKLQLAVHQPLKRNLATSNPKCLYRMCPSATTMGYP